MAPPHTVKHRHARAQRHLTGRRTGLPNRAQAGSGRCLFFRGEEVRASDSRVKPGRLDRAMREDTMLTRANLTGEEQREDGL